MNPDRFNAPMNSASSRPLEGFLLRYEDEMRQPLIKATLSERDIIEMRGDRTVPAPDIDAWMRDQIRAQVAKSKPDMTEAYQRLIQRNAALEEVARHNQGYVDHLNGVIRTWQIMFYGMCGMAFVALIVAVSLAGGRMMP